MGIQIAQFLLALSLLIVLHELGHFIPAKLFKTRVEKFFLFFDGWGKKLISYTYKGTTYGIGWIPLGGYVKISGMVDESMDTDNLGKEPEPWEFRAKPTWQRLIILSGGVIVNFVLGYFIYAMVLFTYGTEYLPNDSLIYGISTNEMRNALGIKTGDKIVSVGGSPVRDLSEAKREFILGSGGDLVLDRNGLEVVIPITDSVVGFAIENQENLANMFNPRLAYVAGQIEKGSGAEEAGLMKNDSIISFNGQPMIMFDQYVDSIPVYAGGSVNIGFVRDGDAQTLDIPVSEEGRIGVGIKNTIASTYEISYNQYTLFESFGEANNLTTDRLSSYVRQFEKLIFKPETGAYKKVGGFLTMLEQYPTTWDWRTFWELTAFISLMLGFLNILPIPALDGGHIVFVLIEMITGKKPSIKVLEIAQTIGFILLLALLIFANGNDIIRKFF